MQDNTGLPDTQLIGLIREFDSLTALVESTFRVWAERGNEQQGERAILPLVDQQGKLLTRICKVSATTQDGLRARAESYCAWDSDMRLLVHEPDNPDREWGDRILACLLRDLLGLRFRSAQE